MRRHDEQREMPTQVGFLFMSASSMTLSRI
nr:MAG TPA: hypothetical protein [Caudoviricetes sp.]